MVFFYFAQAVLGPDVNLQRRGTFCQALVALRGVKVVKATMQLHFKEYYSSKSGFYIVVP